VTRRSFQVVGLDHGTNPTPVASRVGPLVATAAIQGWDRETKQLPADLGEEVTLAFENLRVALEAAGAGLDDVVHINVFAASGAVRPHLNAAWSRHFPDELSRPARHLVQLDLPAGMRIQLEATAYVTEDTND